MLQLNLQDRIKLYRAGDASRGPLYVNNGYRIEGMWLAGRNFKGNGYYGSYPGDYLSRVMSMFPDAEDVLHLFSGAIDPGNYTRFDMNGRGDVQGDAHKLSEYFEPESFDLIVADPPYTGEDADKYGTPMVKRQTVLKEALKVLHPSGIIVWLDQVWPMHSNEVCQLVGIIGVAISTNHRARFSCWYAKSPQAAKEQLKLAV